MLGVVAAQCTGWIVELGSYKGRSTICLAQSSARVLAVDHMQGSEKDKIEGGYVNDLRRNLTEFGVASRVRISERDTVAEARYFNRSVEFLFIDADHDAAVEDLFAWHPLCRRWIAFHDTPVPNVGIAVDSLKAASWAVVGEVDTLIVLEKPE